jgi:thiopurine S-methyltransferase
MNSGARTAARLIGAAASGFAASQAVSSPSDGQDHPISMWADHWSNGKSDWHEAGVNEHLQRHVKELLPPTDSSSRVLVPLCGKSVDMAYLNAMGNEVWGVEGVHEPAAEFFASQKLHFTTVRPGAAVPGASVLMATFPVGNASQEDASASVDAESGMLERPLPALRIAVGNLFELDHRALGTFDAVWDRGSFVAIHPSMRSAYVGIMRDRVRPGGRVLLEAWCHTDLSGSPAPPGPPHSTSATDVASAWGKDFEIELLEHEAVTGREDRFSSGWSYGMYLMTRRNDTHA